MIVDVLVGYWPAWLLLVCAWIFAVTLCRAAALGDRQFDDEAPVPVERAAVAVDARDVAVLRGGGWWAPDWESEWPR